MEKNVALVLVCFIFLCFLYYYFAAAFRFESGGREFTQLSDLLQSAGVDLQSPKSYFTPPKVVDESQRN